MTIVYECQKSELDVDYYDYYDRDGFTLALMIHSLV